MSGLAGAREIFSCTPEEAEEAILEAIEESEEVAIEREIEERQREIDEEIEERQRKIEEQKQVIFAEQERKEKEKLEQANQRWELSEQKKVYDENGETITELNKKLQQRELTFWPVIQGLISVVNGLYSFLYLISYFILFLLVIFLTFILADFFPNFTLFELKFLGLCVVIFIILLLIRIFGDEDSVIFNDLPNRLSKKKLKIKNSIWELQMANRTIKEEFLKGLSEED